MYMRLALQPEVVPEPAGGGGGGSAAAGGGQYTNKEERGTGVVAKDEPLTNVPAQLRFRIPGPA